MARVIHLLDRDADYQTETAVQQLTTRGQSDVSVLTIGRAGDFATPMLAVIHLRKHATDVQIIHAWGMTPLAIAATVTQRKLIFSPTRFPTRNDIRWLRAIQSVRELQIACPTDTIRRRLVERGLPIDRTHLIRPGVEFAKVNRKRNDALRARLGFGPSDTVLLACGESIRPANHNLTILAATVLHLLDPKFKLLLWGRGTTIDSQKRFLQKMLHPDSVCVATDRLEPNTTFESLLPATDLCLITADGPVPTLPIAVCMAAALPIVSIASRTVSELLEDRHTALMVKKGTSRILARRIIDLLDDPQLQWKLSDAAKTEAFEYFSMVRFVSQFRSLHDQFALGNRVELPPIAPGAGLRFQGAGF